MKFYRALNTEDAEGRWSPSLLTGRRDDCKFSRGESEIGNVSLEVNHDDAG